MWYVLLLNSNPNIEVLLHRKSLHLPLASPQAKMRRWWSATSLPELVAISSLATFCVSGNGRLQNNMAISMGNKWWFSWHPNHQILAVSKKPTDPVTDMGSWDPQMVSGYLTRAHLPMAPWPRPWGRWGCQWRTNSWTASSSLEKSHWIHPEWCEHYKFLYNSTDIGWYMYVYMNRYVFISLHTYIS